MPTLFIFSGLPGTGKTTLASRLARRLQAAYVRIDTIEQTLRDQGAAELWDEGYQLGYRIAADNLRLGVDVVADSCNPLDITRSAWEAVAEAAEASYRNIEVICSDTEEHRQRVESRSPTVEGLVLPSWEKVRAREYHPWTSDRLVVDTAAGSEADAEDTLLAGLGIT